MKHEIRTIDQGVAGLRFPLLYLDNTVWRMLILSSIFAHPLETLQFVRTPCFVTRFVSVEDTAKGVYLSQDFAFRAYRRWFIGEQLCKTEHHDSTTREQLRF